MDTESISLSEVNLEVSVNNTQNETVKPWTDAHILYDIMFGGVAVAQLHLTLSWAPTDDAAVLNIESEWLDGEGRRPLDIDIQPFLEL